MGRTAVLLLALAALVAGWGEVGHKAIAELARDRLTTAAKAAVAHYLGAMQMYEVAPMPDDYAFSPAGHWSEPFHFLNIHRGETSYNVADCPVPPSCNVYAIQNFTSVLNQVGGSGPFCSSENDPTEQFPCPLIWLIHVIGDVHQPLHCGYGYDRGGNSVNVTFFGEQTELHAVWDTGMIYHYLDGLSAVSKKDAKKETKKEAKKSRAQGGDWYDLYKFLSSDLAAHPGRESGYAAVTNPVTWANESITYVVTDVYNWNPNALTGQGEPALGQAYYDHNFPIACQRMEAAGVRLAGVLNNALQDKKQLLHFDAALKHQIAQGRKHKAAKHN